MSDPEIHKELFPFHCSNDNCKKCYGFEAFLEISDRFGFIFLSNDECNLFGFTCPECQTTTVRKYILNTCVPNSSRGEQFSHFIPFCSDKIVELCEHDSRCNLFRLPQQITLFHSIGRLEEVEKSHWYTNSFLEKCLFSFCEKDISSILTYENSNKKCLFPRIICDNSVYVFTEMFMMHAEDEGYLELDRNYVIEGFTITMKDIAMMFFDPSRGSDSGFTIEEYRDLTMKYPSIEYIPPKYDAETAIHFLKEYKEQRNDFDFQDTCMSGLFYKYLKSLYYLKGYFRSKLYFEHKFHYESLVGKEFDFELKYMTMIDDPYNHEILTANEVADRWGRDVNILKSFIMNRNLPAYDYKGDWFEIGIPENKDREIDLQNYIFLKSEVEQVEVLTPWLNLKKQLKKDELKVEQPVQKQRPSTVDKIECQKKAKELWDNAKQNGDRVLGTGEMASHPDIEKIGGNYTKAQRQRWISEVAPDESKKPGVRPKKN